jgi:hypothetical protein
VNSGAFLNLTSRCAKTASLCSMGSNPKEELHRASGGGQYRTEPEDNSMNLQSKRAAGRRRVAKDTGNGERRIHFMAHTFRPKNKGDRR